MNMGMTAEKLHDRFPQLTKERADAYSVASQQKAAKSYTDGKIQKDLIPVSAASSEGWKLVDRDELLRPDSNMEGMQGLKTPFRPHGKVTAGNASPLTDGATMSLLAGADAVKKYSLKPKMKLVSFAFAGVEPEVMGYGPVPATLKALEKAGLKMEDIGLIEINEAFAVQVLSFLDHFGIADDDPKVNPWGGAIAMGHPLASSGVRLMNQLAAHFADRPEVRYGMTTMCIGLGMGGTVIWENSNYRGK
jgi:acetyl-CoA acyltransferase